MIYRSTSDDYNCTPITANIQCNTQLHPPPLAVHETYCDSGSLQSSNSCANEYYTIGKDIICEDTFMQLLHSAPRIPLFENGVVHNDISKTNLLTSEDKILSWKVEPRRHITSSRIPSENIIVENDQSTIFARRCIQTKRLCIAR